MISPGQDVPALRASATTRELERIRAKRRLLETAAAAKAASTPPAALVPEAQQPQPVPKPGNDTSNRNARIKSNARKLLDQLQAADTSLGDSSHNLKLLFAKQALRALADRQAAAAAEAQQRKLDQLRERLEEEHRRQHQAKHQQSVQAQIQTQPVAVVQTQVLPQPPAPAPPPVPALQPASSHTLLAHPSPQRMQLAYVSRPRHSSRSRGDVRRQHSPTRRTTSPSRRSSSPAALSSDGQESAGGHTTDSDGTRSDAMHVRDTRRRSSSRSRNRHQDKEGAYDTRPHAPHYREPRHAGPTEAGVRGAVSAQALSALLAGLQSHGVNLTSGPPPPALPAAATSAAQVDAPDGAASSYFSGGGGGRGASVVGTNARDGPAGEQQYVLLPDGTVGLVHTIVKPAVLQPKVAAQAQAAQQSPPPHAVPLVLIQPGGASAATASAAAAPPALAAWPPLAAAGLPYPYGTASPAAAVPPSPYFAAPPLGGYGPQAQFAFPQPLYGMPGGALAPPGFTYSPAAGAPPGTPSPSPPLPQQPVPPYISHYNSPDAYYYRQQQQQGNQDASSPAQSPAPAGQEPQGHTYSQWRPDPIPQPNPGRGGPQSHMDAMGTHVRHSISSLSSEAYGNLGGSVLIGGPTDDGAGVAPRGGGGGDMRGGSAPPPPAGTAAGAPPPHQQQMPVPPSTGSSIATMPSSGNEPVPGNGAGGSGIYGGGRYHHRHSHSGAESLRSLPSNSGGSLRGGGPGSVSLSQQYEATLASPSPRDSLQNLDSPASFRDMPRRTSGSVSFSPLGGPRSSNVGGSIDSGPHFTSGPSGNGGGGGPRRRPSPLYISSSAAGGAPGDPSMPPVGPSGSSGSSSGGSVILRVTPTGSMPQSSSPFAAGGEPSGLGSGAGTGAGDEPSLLLRTLDLGSPSLQRSKMSDEQVETPTSRKPSLTSPWSSSGPSDTTFGLGAGGGSGIGGGGGNTGIYTSTRDLLADVVSRPPLYGTSLPYGTAGLYDRYAAGGFYAATGALYSPSPMYGGPGAGIGTGPGSPGGGSGGAGGGVFSGFGFNNGSGSLGDRLPSGGGGSSAANLASMGGLTQRVPSTDSIRSAGAGARGYSTTANTMVLSPGGAATSSAATDLLGTSAALALTAAILEGSAASAAASSIIAGNAVGLSAASAQGLAQLGLGHLHPTATAASSSGGGTAGGGGPTSPSPSSPGQAASGLGRTSSINRGGGMGSDNGSAGGGSGLGPGQGGMSMSGAANAAVMARLSHTSGADAMFSPRTRSRVQLMGNDDLPDGLSPRSANPSLTNVPSPGAPAPSQQLTSTGSMRLTAAALNAQQQAYQQQQQGYQQQPSSPAQPSPGSRLASRSPGGGSAATTPAGGSAPDLGSLQPTVPTLRLPPRATSRMLGSAVAAATPPGGGGASGGPSSETASPTRIDQGFNDPRDVDIEQSLSARSGRSALSEAHGGAAAAALSISSTDRPSGVPVVEHRDAAAADAASYMGMQAIDPMLVTGIGAAASPRASGMAPPPPLQHPQQTAPALLPLMDLLNNSGFAVASPSGSTALSPLGFGGTSTPLERSADSFVRFGSMPFSGAASPMATGTTMDFLGSPTKQPLGSQATTSQATTGMQRDSSGGGSSGGGGAAGSGGGADGAAAAPGTSRPAVLSTSISAAMPQQQPPVAPPPQLPPQQHPQQVPAAVPSTTPSAIIQPALMNMGLQSPMQPQQQVQQQVQQPQQQHHQQQQQLSGMSFRVSNTGGSVTAAGAGAAAAPATAVGTPPVGGLPRAASISTATPSTAATAAAATRVFSPTGSQSARFPSTTAVQGSPSPRGTGTSFAAMGGGVAAAVAPRAGAPAILSRVLSGRGEFDSDDEDEVSAGVASIAPFVRGPGSGASASQRIGGGSSIIGGVGGSTASRSSPAGAAGLAGRGTLTGGTAAHDDDFNFNF